jgi:alpha-beta hydrolase superfamily lysophospholipase
MLRKENAPVDTTIPSVAFHFASTDGLRIVCSRWDARGPARGVVQIAHGMGEHIGRYADTVAALTFAGLTVYGNDHRGHGRTAPSTAHLGDFGEGGFELLVDDMVRLSRIARDELPGVPFFLLGHSMGSFAAQRYALDHSGDIDGLILSGSGALDGLARLVGSASPGSNLLNAAFEPSRTPSDWLSRDNAVVDALLNESHPRTKLLNRTTRRVTVTADGAAYYERVARILADIDELDGSRVSRRRPRAAACAST